MALAIGPFVAPAADREARNRAQAYVLGVSRKDPGLPRRRLAEIEADDDARGATLSRGWLRRNRQRMRWAVVIAVLAMAGITAMELVGAPGWAMMLIAFVGVVGVGLAFLLRHVGAAAVGTAAMVASREARQAGAWGALVALAPVVLAGLYWLVPFENEPAALLSFAAALIVLAPLRVIPARREMEDGGGRRWWRDIATLVLVGIMAWSLFQAYDPDLGEVNWPWSSSGAPSATTAAPATTTATPAGTTAWSRQVVRDLSGDQWVEVNFLALGAPPGARVNFLLDFGNCPEGFKAWFENPETGAQTLLSREEGTGLGHLGITEGFRLLRSPSGPACPAGVVITLEAE